jgi:hypothetical protein
MKTFKSFLFSLDEVKTVGLKSKLAKTTYMAQMKDPGDLEDVGPEEVGPAGVKSGSGKRPADRLDNKQAFGEADMSKSDTKMAHTIGKHFAKKGVGDPSKGGPYAVATAMVQDKPEAAKKAYATIKAKMKEEKDQDALIALYDSLNEENQKVFLENFEKDADKILEFALSLIEE